MIFDDFTRSQLFGSVPGACTGAQESKKTGIAKNELKHPQTIIECHIKGFKVRLSGLGCHMSPSIFPDFRGFWGVFGGNMSYEESRAKKTPYFFKNVDPYQKMRKKSKFFLTLKMVLK